MNIICNMVLIYILSYMYTVSEGLKLVPRLEPINLSETLKFPLECVKTLLPSTTSSFTTDQHPAISLHICDDITTSSRTDLNSSTSNRTSRHSSPRMLTDKQWLQENILSLLSNAAKYSVDSEEVIVRVYLATYEDIQYDIKIAKTSRKKKCFSTSNNTSAVSSPSHRQRRKSLPATWLPPPPSQDDLDDARNPFSTDLKQKKYLTIEVIDGGIGVTDEQISTLFSPIKQTKRYTGGTGLGLFSLAKRVEALKGFYGVRHRSEGRSGCEFWFAIPYTLVESDDPGDGDGVNEGSLMADISGSTSSEVGEVRSRELSHVTVDTLHSPEHTPTRNTSPTCQPTTITAASAETLNILLADDSLIILKTVGKLLRSQGHTVTEAINGAVALERMNETLYDIVIMDIQVRRIHLFITRWYTLLYIINFTVYINIRIYMYTQMPVMNGIESTRKLRQIELQRKGHNSDLPPIPTQLIVGCSANSDSDTCKCIQTASFIIHLIFNTYILPYDIS